jgi:hypothetical protein
MTVQVTFILHVFLEIIHQSSANHYEYIYDYFHFFLSFLSFQIRRLISLVYPIRCSFIFKLCSKIVFCCKTLNLQKASYFIHAMNYCNSVSYLSRKTVGVCELDSRVSTQAVLVAYIWNFGFKKAGNALIGWLLGWEKVYLPYIQFFHKLICYPIYQWKYFLLIRHITYHSNKQAVSGMEVKCKLLLYINFHCERSTQTA